MSLIYPVYVDTPQSTSSCRWSTCSRRSTRTSCLQVPSDKLSTVGGRALSVSGPTIWNNLPDHVTSAPSLSTFRQRLINFVFPSPSLTLFWSLITVSGSWTDFYYLDHFNFVCLIDWLIVSPLNTVRNWFKGFCGCMLFYNPFDYYWPLNI